MNYYLIGGISGGIFAGVLLAIWCVKTVYAKISEGKIKEHLHQLLFIVDEQCDNMEIPVKRSQAIVAIQSVLGWRRIFLPSVVIGFILDIFVKIIRGLGVPDLHKGDADASGGTINHSDNG